ncbi:MAG: hypothetical protein AAGJ28_06625, partial [Pseudomonadota bacterium]
MRLKTVFLCFTAVCLCAPAALADGYTLRWSSDLYDGTTHFSETRKMDVAYAKRGHISGMKARYLGGAQTASAPEFSLAMQEEPLPANRQSVGLAYDFNRNILLGDAPSVRWYNTYLRPTLSPGLPIGQDAAWQRRFGLEELGLGFERASPISLSFDRRFVSHNGKDYALLSFSFPAMTYTSVAGAEIMHWGRGFAIMDAEFTEIFYSGTWHRGVANPGTPEEQVFSSRNGMQNILDNGSAKLDLGDFDAAADLVRESLKGYEDLATAPLFRRTNRREELDRSFFLAAGVIDMWAAAHVEDSANQLSIIQDLMSGAESRVKSTNDSAVGDTTSAVDTIKKILSPFELAAAGQRNLNYDDAQFYTDLATDYINKAKTAGNAEDADNYLRLGSRYLSYSEDILSDLPANSVKGRLLNTLDTLKSSNKLTTGVKATSGLLGVVGDVGDVLTTANALTNSDPSKLTGSDSTSVPYQIFERVVLDVVLGVGSAVAQKDYKGIVLGTTAVVTKSISDIGLSGVGALNAQDEAALAKAGLNSTQIAFVNKLLEKRSQGVDLTDKRNIKRAIEELDPDIRATLDRGIERQDEERQQTDPPVGTDTGTQVQTDPPIGTGPGTSEDPPGGADTRTDPPGDTGTGTRTDPPTTGGSGDRTTQTTTLPPAGDDTGRGQPPQTPADTTVSRDRDPRKPPELDLSVDYPTAPPRVPKPDDTPEVVIGQTSELPQELLDQIQREIELEDRRRDLGELQDNLIRERDERDRRAREDRDARNQDVVDIFGDFMENNAFGYEDMAGIVPTDLSPYLNWLETQNLQRLERLARNGGYPNLATALSDYVNLITQATDQGFRQYALGSYQGAGLAGFLPSIASRNLARARLALGDLLIASGFIQSLGGLTDITISGNRLSITLFDFGIEDGDVVTLFINQLNQQILQQTFTLSNAGTTVSATLRSSIPAAVTVTALNEGFASPNTAGVTLSPVTSGNSAQSYSLNTGESAVLRVQ